MNYFIVTIGCQMNKADGERLAAYLESLGYAEAADFKTADLVALVTCGVRQSAEDRVYGLVKQIKRDKPSAKIILTGCLSDRSDVQERLGAKIDLYFNIANLPGLAVELGFAPLVGSEQGYLNLSAKYQSAYSAYVPIGNGCDNFCSYCVVPYARGREVYRGHEEILAEVKHLLARGYKEIILIAQNVNSYYSSLERGARRAGCVSDSRNKEVVNFPALLKMVAELPGDFWLRFATSHPKDMSDELIAVVAGEPKICKHFHIALQSGDDEILRLMNRKYTAGQFLILLNKIRALCPKAGISTDIIVGFPGESKAQFLNTKKIMHKASFIQAYIAKYSPRPQTAAAKLPDDVEPAEKEARAQELELILRAGALSYAQSFVGRATKVLVEKKRGAFYYGKNEQFLTVKFPAGDRDLIGSFANIKINSVQPFGLLGDLNSYDE